MKRKPKQTGQTEIIGYRRVSTDKQKQSGLGLDAQTWSVEGYAKSRGMPVTAWYDEAESGTHSDRPQLKAALAHAKRANALLVIAKLDRLSRNVAFLSELMESEVEFIAADMPNANRLTLHLMGAMAEAEAEAISQRTKAALQAYKRDMRVSKRLKALYPNGVPNELYCTVAGKLGSARPGHWDGREHLRLEALARGRIRSSEVRAANTREAYVDILPLIQEMRANGATLWAIAKRLNEDGRPSRRGGRWTQTQVGRVLALTSTAPHPRP